MTDEEARAWLTVYAMLWPTGVVLSEEAMKKAEAVEKKNNINTIRSDEELSRLFKIDLEPYNRILWAMAVSDAL